MCDHCHMMRVDSRSFVAGIGCALLAAVVLCPLMATAASASTASSCHDRPDPDHHDDGSPAFICCATVVATASIKAALDADVASTPAADSVALSVPRTARHAEDPRPRSMSPPLFVRHAALLI